MTLAPDIDIFENPPGAMFFDALIWPDGPPSPKPRTKRGKGLGPRRSGAKGRHARRDSYSRSRHDRDDWGDRRRKVAPPIEIDDDSPEPSDPFTRRGGKGGGRPYTVQSRRYEVEVSRRSPRSEQGRRYPSSEDAMRYARGGQRGTPRYA